MMDVGGAKEFSSKEDVRSPRTLTIKTRELSSSEQLLLIDIQTSHRERSMAKLQQLKQKLGRAKPDTDGNKAPAATVPWARCTKDGVLIYSNGDVHRLRFDVNLDSTDVSGPSRFKPIPEGITGTLPADVGVKASANIGAGIAAAGVSVENGSGRLSRSIDHFTYTFGKKATSVGKTTKSFVGVALLGMAVLVYGASIFRACLYCLAKPDWFTAVALAVLLPILLMGSASVGVWLALQVLYAGTSRRGAVY